MGQSLVQNYIHIIFRTKHREPLIQPPVEQELHAYLGGICKQLESQSIIVGGYTDHIHILCKLSKKNTIDEDNRRIKIAFVKMDKNKGKII